MPSSPTCHRMRFKRAGGSCGALSDIPHCWLAWRARRSLTKTMKRQKWKHHATNLTCPECRGPISESRKGPVTEFHCRVGHSYSPETFLAAHAETRERSLWAAVVALEEGAEVARELGSPFSGC